jgi:hypothetical protein
MHFTRLLILLFAGHALCDGPLQGTFLSNGKNRQIPGVPWYQCLGCHALIQAGMVLVITNSIWLAIAELIIHAATDYAKGLNWISGAADQGIHFGCKLLWAIIMVADPVYVKALLEDFALDTVAVIAVVLVALAYTAFNSELAQESRRNYTDYQPEHF